jgi:hypothetical protein
MTRRLRRARLRHIATLSSTAMGCTCTNIEVRIVGADLAKVGHDDGCPLEDLGRVYVVVPDDFGGCDRAQR